MLLTYLPAAGGTIYCGQLAQSRQYCKSLQHWVAKLTDKLTKPQDVVSTCPRKLALPTSTLGPSVLLSFPSDPLQCLAKVARNVGARAVGATHRRKEQHPFIINHERGASIGTSLTSPIRQPVRSLVHAGMYVLAMSVRSDMPDSRAGAVFIPLRNHFTDRGV